MALKHQAVAARKWRSAVRQIERHLPAHLPPLLFLTDPKRTPDPAQVIPALPTGTGVIYRHFGAANRRDVALMLREACVANGGVFMIAADPALARETGADGVHWPEAKLVQARAWRHQFAIQTASAHSRAAIQRAANAGMDAALVSSVFASRSDSAGPPLSAARFRQLSAHAGLPIYALGGVHANNAAQVSFAGGIAAIDGLAAAISG